MLIRDDVFRLRTPKECKATKDLVLEMQKNKSLVVMKWCDAMGINQKDIKLLWGRSGNRCAICKTELTQDKDAVTASFTLGEQAHIVGEKEDAARGVSSLTLEERNSYHNLILLCPTHHAAADKNKEDWPVEKLHQVKSEHELFVTETLSSVTDQKKLAKQIAVTSVIDSAVNLCKLDNWENWTSSALSPVPTWPSELPSQIFKFRQKVISAIWPKEYEELKRATITFSVLINVAAQTFMKHSELKGDIYYPHKFYKVDVWNENYDEDLNKYLDWIDTSHLLIREATKALNWFADVVRRDINPMFFVEAGKFLVLEGDILFGYTSYLLEFSDEEQNKYPEALDNQLNRPAE